MKLLGKQIVTEILYNPEKSDIFSLGISYLRIILLLRVENLSGLNY